MGSSWMVTGHRDFKSNESVLIKEELTRVISKLKKNNGMSVLLTGMAVGADRLAVESIETYKRYGDELFVSSSLIPFEAYIPYFGQDKDVRWSQADRAWWFMALGRAAKIHVASRWVDDTDWADRFLEPMKKKTVDDRFVFYDKSKSEVSQSLIVKSLHYRNDLMIERSKNTSGGVIAVWDGRKSGGTWSVIKKAGDLGIQTVIIDTRQWLKTGRGEFKTQMFSSGLR